MGSNPLSDIMREHIVRLISKDERADGRTREQFRPLTITTGYVTSAEGSALVNLGDTRVLVGLKSIVGEPFADTPDKGVLTTNAELIPLASETFESGPPSEVAIEIARVVDRGLREGKAVNFEKLCIKPGEEVWINFIDIHALDYDGNLFDAANIAAVAALKSATIPASKMEKGDDFPFPMVHLPISATFAKVNGHLIADPSFDEESVANARLTVVTLENQKLCAMQKGIGGSFSREEIEKAIDLSLKWGEKVRSEHFAGGD